MAVLLVEGFEQGALAAVLANTSGTCSVQSTVKRSGTYAFRSNPTGTAVGHGRILGIDTGGAKVAGSNNISVSPGYFSFYFRWDTKPASGNEPFLIIFTTAGTGKIELRLKSDGAIELRNPSTSGLVDTTTLLTGSGTWYRIEGDVRNGNAATEIRIHADDPSDTLLDTLNGTFEQNGAMGFLRIGKTTNISGQTVDFYYDDFAIGDALIPTGKVGIIKTNAVGDTDTFPTGTFADVDDNPHDSDGTFKLSTAGAGAVGQVYLSNFESLSDAGITDVGSIHCVQVRAITRKTSGTITVKTRVRSGGNNYDSSGAASLSGAYDTTNNWASYSVDPATSATWTIAGVDALQAGILISTADSSVRITSVIAEIYYTPGGDAPLPGGRGHGGGIGGGQGHGSKKPDPKPKPIVKLADGQAMIWQRIGETR